MDLHYVTTQIDFFKMNQLDINSFTLYLDNKLEEKIKEGKEKGRKKKEGNGYGGRVHFICLEGNERKKKEK